ncbi:MAG: dienelactone hydrolase family protein [Planctomycetota bacterium]|jgi:hypothetical protein
MRFVLLIGLFITPACYALSGDWELAEQNGKRSQRVIKFCNRYAHGWLDHADPNTGLLPRTVTRDAYWNARDCAADNYPFMVLTAYVTEDYYLKQIVHTILKQEQKLTNRLDSLPDDYLFATRKFRTAKYKLNDLIFGASEYAKDGLMPITEWIGPGAWLKRMKGLIEDIWKHAPHNTQIGKIPSHNAEVNGELMQTMSRMYWATGDNKYKIWVFRLADQYLLYNRLIEMESLRLRDHGCEIMGGLSEAYVIAAHEDKARWKRYKPEIHALLDRILKSGTNEDGMMFDAINPKTGEVIQKRHSDGWGYVYNAFLTVAEVDGVERYRQAVINALNNIHKYAGDKWQGHSGADEYADSIEGAINLLNRIPVKKAMDWADEEINLIFNKQRHDGIIEGWYGDGNSARTAIMYGLWKTQGITAAPWREDLQLGALRDAEGTVKIYIKSEWKWTGHLRFDHPRHKDFLHLPFDYPRINQFPEWFTVDNQTRYQVQHNSDKAAIVDGQDLLNYKLTLQPNKPLLLTVKPQHDQAAKLRTMKYSARSAEQALTWQSQLRSKLSKLLKMDDLMGTKIPLKARILATDDLENYTSRQVEINSTASRRIKITVTQPYAGNKPYPAVVCIHGHGGNRQIIYDHASIYKGFASILAANEVITIATNVGQHKIFETNRSLMGERLWDLIRCVDYLETLPQVDTSRIGCAGLSLGGEMAMWLAAMDQRIAATVSSGFLTTMDQMEQKHCMCWKFDGLRELVDYADIYSLIAPRPLQCQNGLNEPAHAFIVPLARQAMKEIKLIYSDLGKANNVTLAIHQQGHVIDLPSLRFFFEKHFSIAIK